MRMPKPRCSDRVARRAPEFYAENGLNLNERGYAAWTAALRPTIERMRAAA